MKPPEEQGLGRAELCRAAEGQDSQCPRSLLRAQGSGSGWVGGAGYDVTLGPSHSSPCDPLQSLDYAEDQFTLKHLLAMGHTSLSVENTGDMTGYSCKVAEA